MTVDKQPRALYLADVLAAGFECDQEWYEIESAKELRRLYAENEELKDQCDELLEALRNLSDLYDTDEGCRSLPEYIAARAAIAKATGETK